jgi:hypothetical protein
MIRHKRIGIGCLIAVLLTAGRIAWAAHPNQQQGSTSSAEYSAYENAHDGKDAESRIKLLDDFAIKYPNSVLALYEYQDYYVAYFSVGNYPQAAAYADRLLALGEKADINSRMLALETREMAYSIGCGDNAFQTPEASIKAKDAATQGLQMLNQWQKPENLTNEQFAAEKASLGIILNSVASDADARLKGDALVCYHPTSPDPGRFDRMIEQILSEQRHAPRVR